MTLLEQICRHSLSLDLQPPTLRNGTPTRSLSSLSHIDLCLDHSVYSDARTYLLGPRSVRLRRVCTAGMYVPISYPTSLLSINNYGAALRDLRSAEPQRFGSKLDASRNLWEGSGLKVDSAQAVTDVGWELEVG